MTDAALCGEFGVVATVEAALGAGVTVVQLRDDNLTDEEFVNLGRAIMRVVRLTDAAFIVNNRVHLVEAIGADGTHVGQSDLGVAEARALLGPHGYLGLSVQSVEHVTAALAAGSAGVDYLGVGPVFATTTKLDAATPGGLERLAEIVSVSPWPCVAIGGVTHDRLGEVHRAGAAGAAVVSAICGQYDVTTATRALRRAWDHALE